MLKRTTVALATLVALALGVPAHSATWQVDQAHSSVYFKVRHLVVAKTKGEFTDFNGTINFDGKNWSDASAEFTVQAASIDTDNEDRDKHLRSADFLAADSFPTMTFVTKSVTPAEDGEFKLTGDLTIRGVTKEVTFDGEFHGVIQDPWGNTRAGFTAETTIDRQEFGVSWNKTLDAGGVVVSDDVDITLEIEAIQKADQES